MVLLGFMHYRKKPTNKAYAYAAVAKSEGAEVLYFSPGAIDFEKKKIAGFMYLDGEWKKVTSDFPSVIFNIVGFARERQNQILDRLSEEVPFTSFPIGSKVTVYKNLMARGEFSNYLVPSEEISSVEQFFSLLNKYEEVVIKPSMGCQGKNVYYIKKQDEFYEIISGPEKTKHTFAEISAFVSDKISKDDYLIQPFINCRTKSGNSYDFRLHVQKNASGKWTIGKIYPRIAERGSIVCNISSGGYTGDLTAFLKKEFGKDYFDVQSSMEKFSLQLAAHLDMIQKHQYNEELDELGIDIGLDKNKKIWIYEINWRPGYPPSMNLDLNIVKNSIHYAMFKAQKRKEENTNENNNFYRNK